MAEVNEINSTFYAMRLLAHHLDLSDIGVSEGDEYPATEFTPEEQARALEIAREAQIKMQGSLKQAGSDFVEPVITRLADRIDELATKELVDAGIIFNVILTEGSSHSLVEDATAMRDKRRLVEGKDIGSKRLSSQERRVLRLMREGRSTQEIADLLHVSVPTVTEARLKLKTKTENLTESRQAGTE